MAEGLAPTDEFEGVRVDRFRYAVRRLETLAYDGTMADQVRRSWTARGAMAGMVAAELFRASRLVRAWRPQLVHAHWWFPGGAVGTTLGRWRDLPCLTTLHGSDVRVLQGGAGARKLFRFVMSRSTAVTAVSSWLADEAKRIAPDLEPIVAPMPVVTGLFGPTTSTTTGVPRLLFVGKLNPQKGIEHLLHALVEMRQECALDVVVGVGSAETEARALATSLGIAHRIRWHPLLPQTRLAEMYRTATALVMPSVDEGLSLVAIEAQLSGTPVVAFRSGGLPDVVDDGDTGLLVPPRDRTALAAALDRILDLPDRGAAMGRAARQRAVERFAPEAVARRYADIYRHLAAEAQTRRARDGRR
jgi:glycosyltransferase involved in cell wall biosynthesis